MSSVLGYEADDLIGKSLFEFQHGEDSASLMKSFKSGKLLSFRILLVRKSLLSIKPRNWMKCFLKNHEFLINY